MSGQPIDAIYPDGSGIGEVLRHPTVAGAIESLVGRAASFDHDFVHLKQQGDLSQQSLHADAVIDTTTAFDIQVFYFPHAVEAGGGGTGFIPGTHLRRVHETQVGRYRHMRGQQQWVGPAGSVLIFHHGLWHRGMPNPSSTDRLMYKIRLNPTVPQIRRWDISDLDERQALVSDHIFAVADQDGVGSVLRHREPWMGSQDHRLETMNRLRLWRYVCGDDQLDLDWYLTRIERRQALEQDRP